MTPCAIARQRPSRCEASRIGGLSWAQRAEPLVTVGRGKREMRRRRLRRGDVLVFAEEDGFLLAGDVQHVHAFSGLARERD